MGLKEKIEELEEKHNFIANNLIDAIFVVDIDTLKFEYITPSIKKISGYSPNEYLKSTIEKRLGTELFQKLKERVPLIKKEFAEGKEKGFKTFELELSHRDGHFYWIEIRVRLYKKINTPLKMVGVIREISALKQEEDKNKSLIKKLKTLVKEKEALLNENKVLRGFLPICSGCKRICDENGKWWPIDFYVREHTDAEITHSICPDCKNVFYGSE